MSRRSVRWLMLTTAIAGLASVAPVYATSTGITTLSFDSMGCNLCHFSGTVPSVSLTGPTVVMLMLDRNDYLTTNAKSPARCTQQLCVTGPMGHVEPNTTNDCTELVVDVFDANDF